MVKLKHLLSFIMKSIVSAFLLVVILYFSIFVILAPNQKTVINNTITYDKITPYELNNNSITYNDDNIKNPITNSVANNLISSARQEVINKAKAMAEVKWSPRKNIIDKISKYIFLKGKTYYGIPYSMDSYQVTSANDFLSKINSTNSLIGNDCSGFVSAAWNIKRQTTLTLFCAAKNGVLVDGKVVKEISWNDIKTGDALLHDNGKGKGHIMLYVSTDTKNSDSLTVYEQNVSTLVPFQPIPVARKDTRSKTSLIKQGYFPIRLMTLN